MEKLRALLPREEQHDVEEVERRLWDNVRCICREGKHGPITESLIWELVPLSIAEQFGDRHEASLHGLEVCSEGEVDEAVQLLCRKARSGDQNAFNTLWLMHVDQIRGYIKLNTHLPSSDREDFLSFAYLEILEDMRCYDPSRATFMAFASNRIKYLRWKYWRLNRIGLGSGGDDEGPRDEVKDDENVEDTVANRLRLVSLLEQIFNMDSPPHQLILFGYVRMLQYKPGEIASEYRYFQLRAMLRILSGSVGQLCGGTLPMDALVAGLQGKMDQPLREVITHWRTREMYKNFLNETTGDLRLYQYAHQSDYKTLEEYVTAQVSNVVRQLMNVLEQENSSSMRDSASKRAVSGTAAQGLVKDGG